MFITCNPNELQAKIIPAQVHATVLDWHGALRALSANQTLPHEGRAEAKEAFKLIDRIGPSLARISKMFEIIETNFATDAANEKEAERQATIAAPRDTARVAAEATAPRVEAHRVAKTARLAEAARLEAATAAAEAEAPGDDVMPDLHKRTATDSNDASASPTTLRRSEQRRPRKQKPT